MHAISSYRGNRNRPPACHKHRPPAVRPPQTGPITIHCAAMLSAQCKICNGVADCPAPCKHVPPSRTLCYHADFGRSLSNRVENCRSDHYSGQSSNTKKSCSSTPLNRCTSTETCYYYLFFLLQYRANPWGSSCIFPQCQKSNNGLQLASWR